MRTSTVSPILTFNFRASGSFNAISVFSSATALPFELNFQKPSSTPSTCAPFTRTLPFAALAEPVARIAGTSFTERTSFSVNHRSPPKTPDCTLPNRNSATRRKLARTESPTSSEPLRIAEAKKAPKSSPRCPRQ